MKKEIMGFTWEEPDCYHPDVQVCLLKAHSVNLTKFLKEQSSETAKKISDLMTENNVFFMPDQWQIKTNNARMFSHGVVQHATSFCVQESVVNAIR